ncbi:MAG: hypothetical protein ABMA64_12090 [Myxococcota bacterium]
MILSFAALFSSVAGATDYDAELAIPSEHPQWMKAGYAPTYKRFLYKLSPSQNPGDGVVNSTDSRVKCRVKSSWVILEFSADRAHWPSTLPLSATCVYGPDTLEVSVVPYAPEVDPAFQQMEILTTSAGPQVDITRFTNGLDITSFNLPTTCSGEFVVGTYGSTLDAVACRVFYRSAQPVVQVRVLEAASIGVGSCTLPLDDDTDYVLTINLDEHDP